MGLFYLSYNNNPIRQNPARYSDTESGSRCPFIPSEFTAYNKQCAADAIYISQYEQNNKFCDDSEAVLG